MNSKSLNASSADAAQPSSSLAARSVDAAVGSRARPRLLLLAMAAACVSIVIVVWMYVGSLVTYAPDVSAQTVQNIDLSRMLSYGTVLIALQLVILGILAHSWRSQTR